MHCAGSDTTGGEGALEDATPMKHTRTAMVKVSGAPKRKISRCQGPIQTMAKSCNLFDVQFWGEMYTLNMEVFGAREAQPFLELFVPQPLVVILQNK